MVSSAPVGGYSPTMVLLPGQAAPLNLIGYDADLLDQSLTSRIITAPARGKLTLNGVALTQGSSVSVSDSLQFIPDNSGGGQPYANFAYETVDKYGVVSGARVTVIVNVMCGLGTRVDQDKGVCAQCDEGTVQPINATFSTVCTR